MSTRQTVRTHFVLGVAILLAPSLVACQETQAAQPRLPIEAAKEALPESLSSEHDVPNEGPGPQVVDERAEHAEAITAAYQRLLSLKSARVAEEWVMDRLGGSIESRSLAVLTDGRGSGVRELTEEANCVESGTYRECDLLDKKTGEKVGSMWLGGGRRINEGVLVPPDTYHYRSTEVYEHGPTGTSEFLRTGGNHYGKYQSVWRQTRNCCGGRPIFSEVFEPLPDSIERLADTEVVGEAAAHYRGTRELEGPNITVLEWWIGKLSGLPLKVVSHRAEGEFGNRVEYLFSNFDEPVDIPDPTQSTSVENLRVPPYRNR